MWTAFNVYKFLHVLGAMVWFGAAVTLNVMLARLGAANDDVGKAKVAEQATWFSRAVFDPSAIAVLLFGILMVVSSDSYTFSEPLVSIGFAGIIVTLGIGHGLITPTVRRMGEVIAAEGPGSASVAPLEKRVALYSTIDIVVLVIVIWAMVFKP